MNERVSKNDLIATVAAKTGLEKGTTRNLIDSLFDAIRDELAAGNEVAIAGQVKFSHGVRAAIKKGTPTRNPSTGETSPHAGRPASLRIKATPLKAMKDAVPAPTSKIGKGVLASKAR